MTHLTKIILFLGIVCTASTPGAQTAPEPGASFMKVFTGLCLNRLNDLEALRAELKAKSMPMMQESAARVFLDGHPGDAWPVPELGILGNLVLTLPSDHPQCSLVARRGPQAAVETQFADQMSKAPAPFFSQLKTDERSRTATNGETHTLGYVWSVNGASRGLAFFLTTATSPEASLQLKATATRVAIP
jgi:hypothetical protein